MTSTSPCRNSAIDPSAYLSDLRSPPFALLPSLSCLRSPAFALLSSLSSSPLHGVSNRNSGNGWMSKASQSNQGFDTILSEHKAYRGIAKPPKVHGQDQWEWNRRLGIEKGGITNLGPYTTKHVVASGWRGYPPRTEDV